MHFLHYALFQEELTSAYYYGVTFLIVLIGAALGYRSKRALQMGSQYRWMFHSEGMFWTRAAAALALSAIKNSAVARRRRVTSARKQALTRDS